MKLPSELRETDPRRKIPAKSYAQKAVRDAQFSAIVATKGQCSAAYWGMEEADGNIRTAKKLRARGAKSAARTVNQAHRYIDAVCDRYDRPIPEPRQTEEQP